MLELLVDKDSQEFPCETNSQTLVLAIEVHELVEQDRFMAEVSRVLQVNGIFVGVFQNKHSWRAVMNLKSMLTGTMKHYIAGYAPWKRRIKTWGFETVRKKGICWMPFGRMSNSKLVPAATFIEKTLFLRRMTSVSPWIVFGATKGPKTANDLGASHD